MTTVFETQSDTPLTIELPAENTIISESSSEVHIFESTPESSVFHIFESTPETSVFLESETSTTNIIETSPPQGLKGDKGDGSFAAEYTVAYPMSGHRIVVLDENQEAIYATNLNPIHANKILGMTTEAVISGLISVQFNGLLEEPSWSWMLDVPVWLSTDGLLTQIPPTSGFSLIVGFPVSAIKIFIDIREPIFLA